MAKEENGSDYYKVLGVEKNCSASELRDAYKKLALRWHPDRISASGNSVHMEEAKRKFQTIQEAYSVLSNENERVMYDLGIYDNDDNNDGDEYGMGEFLGEMMAMMKQTTPYEDAQEGFEDLQNILQGMYEDDKEFYDKVSPSSSFDGTTSDMFNFSYNDSFTSNKKNCSSMGQEKSKMEFDMGSINFGNFCVGKESADLNSKGRGGTSMRTGKKQKASSRKDMSSHDSKVVA